MKPTTVVDLHSRLAAKLAQEPSPNAAPDIPSDSALEAGSSYWHGKNSCKGAGIPEEALDGGHAGAYEAQPSVSVVQGQRGLVNFDAITCPRCRQRPCRCLEARAPRHVIRPELPLFDTDPGDAA